jgi:hypothetical protein
MIEAVLLWAIVLILGVLVWSALVADLNDLENDDDQLK